MAEQPAPDEPGTFGECTTTPALLELVPIIARLRRECAWKAAQTHRSLTRYLLEEAHEAVDAIDVGDPARVQDELGDVLLQVYLHAAIAAESGEFDIEDVAAGLRDKMIRRNPHVFGDEVEDDPARINERWQQIKASERRHGAGGPGPDTDLGTGIPQDLPVLLRALKMLERLDRSGARAPDPVDDADFGARLLGLVDEARRAGVDPEQALRDTLREVTGPTR
ncbi:MazG nucleotide pyrophosphohydrolase domain-containing protein [Nocardioides terrisoli]|uniref:MazG nucleotide pyrophosphohydrolase domain-containing protein n=1 Tax=Nocardioides terrisoli TaxID=3388267 RepID=UPI00287B6D7F|nr:MazG nucleotide pyrophosphohydrolase domain-containing protein [Nocardioides marmorisolisilvae]